MGGQSVRQAARRAALTGQAQRREARAVRERRLDELAVEVHTALGERAAAVAAAERRAGQALQTMTRDAGLTLAQAADWCGGGFTVREVARLRQLATAATTGDEPATAAAGPTDTP